MRLWTRRKIIYDWNSNFTHAVNHYKGPFTDVDFDWHAPLDGYGRLTGIYFEFIAVAGLRGATSLRFYLYHANYCRYYMITHKGPFATATYAISMSPNIVPTGYASTNIRPIPQPTRVIPGDWFKLHTFAPLPGDAYANITITLDWYEFR